MIEETLLERFIREKVESYEEPPRKGVKGNPPGRFSAKKHRAVLLMLRAGTQKAIAREVGVSQALLLNWRTEAAFQNMVIFYLRKFIALFMENVREISLKYSPENFPPDAFAEFSDVSDYSNVLKASILNCVLWIDRKDMLNNGWPILIIFRDILFATSGRIGAIEAGVLTLRLIWLKHLFEKLNQAPLQGYPMGLVRIFMNLFLRSQEELFKIYLEKVNKIFPNLPKQELTIFLEDSSFTSISSRILISWTFQLKLNNLFKDR